jgi:hypothetical protein
MTSSQLREVREANPFRPFTIHLADGRSLRVPHRDYLSMSPSGRTVLVYKADDAFSFLDLYLVTELEIDPVPTSTAGDAA